MVNWNLITKISVIVIRTTFRISVWMMKGCYKLTKVVIRKVEKKKEEDSGWIIC